MELFNKNASEIVCMHILAMAQLLSYPENARVNSIIAYAVGRKEKHSEDQKKLFVKQGSGIVKK